MITTFDPSPPFKSAHSRGKWATIFLKLCILLNISAFVSYWFEASLITRAIDGQILTDLEVAANYDRQQTISAFYNLLFIITAILVLRWIHRTNRNLYALGAIDLEFTPKWAVAWFFFPILNLFRPFQAVAEIWKASNPQYDGPTGTVWRIRPLPPILRLWWAAWVASYVSNAVALIAARQTRLEILLNSTWVALVSSLMSIIAAASLINIIKTVDAWQQIKFDQLRLSEAPIITNMRQAPVRATPALSSSIRRVPAPWVSGGQRQSS